MKVLLALLVFVVAASALTAEDRFVEFTKTYAKKYATPEETMKRFAIFKDALAQIEKLNKESDQATFGINEFADFTNEEFLSMYANTKVPLSTKRVYADLSKVNAPASVDWRSAGAVNPIRNQGQCGSCWAFSAISALEGAIKIKKGTLPQLSEQELVDCSSSYGNNGCSGGWMNSAFNYLKSKPGACTLASYPYKAVQGTCKACTRNPYPVTGIYNVVQYNELALKNAVALTPVCVAINASPLQYYKSGIFSGSCSASLNHGVTVVGYGTEGATPYWLIRNSWGTSWGETGYFRLIRHESSGAVGQCGITLYASYPTV